MAKRYVGSRDATLDRVVVKEELNAVQTIAQAASTQAAVKPDWDALAGADAEILNKPADVVLNDTLTSTSTTEAATANTVRQLNDKIDGLGDGIVVADVAARDTETGLDVGDALIVQDGDGAGNWIKYRITAAGDGTFAGATSYIENDQVSYNAASSGTDLSVTADATKQTVESSDGSNVDLLTASGTQAGILTGAQYGALQDKGKIIAIPGDGATVSFTLAHGYTDPAVSFELWEVATQEFVGISIKRAANSTDVIVGDFATAPPNATSYQLHVVRG